MDEFEFHISLFTFRKYPFLIFHFHISSMENNKVDVLSALSRR